MTYLPYHLLPSPLDKYALAVLESNEDAEYYLFANLCLFIVFAFVQLKVFSRPPPVPFKKLPQRPALSILFKPDDITSSSLPETQSVTSGSSRLNPNYGPGSSTFLRSSFNLGEVDPVMETVKEVLRNVDNHSETPTPPFSRPFSVSDSVHSEEDNADTKMPESSGKKTFDLPDSFAPLLSSSQTEMLLHQLTADLIHGIHTEASVRMRAGRHEIPLDKDHSRPQFVVDVPKGGCRLSAIATVGSDRFSSVQDLDVKIPTSSRSKPMVKHAGLVFDPPLPLKNVAPTLIHFPTLFEDNTLVPKLRSIHIIRFFMNAVVAFNFWIEKLLWIVESFLQIHLGKIRITPVYKGRNSLDDTSPEWRLTLAFSGHVMLFGVIPIPFISIVLPIFIMPQPHALLDYLLSKQPLASATIRRENIAEQRVALAIISTAESWTAKMEAVATPPAVGIDLTLSGGVSLGLELMHGRDPIAGRARQDAGDGSNFNLSKDPFPAAGTGTRGAPPSSGASLSSWTTNDDSESVMRRGSPFRATNTEPFDANNLVPWKFELSAKGTIDDEKMSFHLLNCSFQNEDSKSQFRTRGSFVVWKADINAKNDSNSLSKPYAIRRSASFTRRALLASATGTPSVAEIFLFPDDDEGFRTDNKMLEYDYAFDVSEDSRLDAITFSVGANHPMLDGGTMLTTILESIYAYGSVSARQHAILDPMERKRKRNILRHLPAIDFTFGIQNSYIPPESFSYTDDGQTRSLPRMEGGRMMVRFLGGIQENVGLGDETSPRLSVDGPPEQMHKESVSEGIKVIADFGFSSIAFNSETSVKEFPEFDIFDGTKLRAVSDGKLVGRIKCHLRPQMLLNSLSTTGPNIFNPLEAYEIDFSGTSLSVRVREWSTSLGHRRIIMPTETTIKVKVVESVVDMALEGRSKCELSWDFQGLSPILQVTDVGLSPEIVVHEKKQQVSLLIDPLRQGRLNFHVSPVGGINITKAETTREDKEGLYDWKFFNAFVSPDEQSAERLMDVIHDKRSMNKLLQVIKLINADCHRALNYILTQVWRAKEILDQEGVSDPKHIIPGHRMARLISLFLCNDLSQVGVVLPIIRRVTAGDGLDVVGVKELLRKHCDFYDDWTPEIDRGVRWLETMFTPFTVPPPYVEDHVTPLAQQEIHYSRFKTLPSAAQLYEQIHDRPHLPLDRNFSNMVGRVAPYLSFSQIEYFLNIRSSKDWQPYDLKRLRYVYSVKRKVMDIAESYGGLPFLPQSFLVSVYLGEATRASLRATQTSVGLGSANNSSEQTLGMNFSHRPSTLLSLRQRRAKVSDPILSPVPEENFLTAAGRVASMSNIPNSDLNFGNNGTQTTNLEHRDPDQYELGDCLLGPADVATLLQAGLTSVMKGSSVVQLNQRMLLDLIASQPKSFAVAVLAEIGTPGGQGSPRQLTSALMALLELDQNSFRPIHRLDMHALLESWLPGIKVPRRDDYMAGGRWARQSYYEALFSLASSIMDDAECYMAMKCHLQRYRHHLESDPIPQPREEQEGLGNDFDGGQVQPTKLVETITVAREKIKESDEKGHAILTHLVNDEKGIKDTPQYSSVVHTYREAFEACARVRELDKLAFHSDWFKEFYRRNVDALVIKSLYDNVIDDIDKVRYWLHCLRRGDKLGAPRRNDKMLIGDDDSIKPAPMKVVGNLLSSLQGESKEYNEETAESGVEEIGGDRLFLEPENHSEQALVDAIIDAIIYEKKDRERLKNDPLVRLLIPNPPGSYEFTIVTAMGVITDGKAGTELENAFRRLEKERGVKTIRSDVGTARSLEFNASKIIEAIKQARTLMVPYGLIGYSQGCANVLMAETLLHSGTPRQQEEIADNTGLVCRQLLFSAANASIHGPATEKKVQRLIVMVEEFFKYQQGYFSRQLQSVFLEVITNLLDSPQFHKMMGGAQTFLSDGSRSFWREGQHLAHVPTCSLRGVTEEHTTPEALEMLINMLTKQSGSSLHDSQVHAYDAVGHPVYHRNRNGRILEKCDIGAASIERTHHWSPLNKEVEFITTPRDFGMAAFDCAKDRHVFPWVDVNARFGFIKYSKPKDAKIEKASIDGFEADQII